MHDEVPRILAIRHGETAWNVATRIQGQLDVPLNETGRWQAARVAGALADERIDAIYSSDLKRAHDTALAVQRELGCAIVSDTGLRERHFGEFEGWTWKEIEERWPQQSERWRRRELDFAPDGGESLLQFYARVVDCATRLAAAHPGQTLVWLTHGGVLDCLYRAASRIELNAPRSWQLGNASINRLLYTPEGFTLVGWADTYHLEDDSLDESSDRVEAA